ncbi:MAG: 4-hydroxy-3-methylbut-2-enyl diphosphate reductase [Candidatus Altimarinota bacterium]
MNQFLIYTAFPRGYCAGVHRAISMLAEIINEFPPPVYVNHEIIHNRFVVDMFERKGVIFESNLDKIPDGSLVVVSAHGAGPSFFAKLRVRKMRWIDATCPLVDKVHKEARKFIKDGYHILYVGKKGHQEAIGVIDEGKDHITLIEDKDDLKEVNIESPLVLLTQTTLSVDETENIIKEAKLRFPHITLPNSSDICYATTNRQNAVKALADTCDIIIVVGSKNSSNSNKLKQVAESLGKTSYLIDHVGELDQAWLKYAKNVGVTAGASGPEELVQGVIEGLETLGGIYHSELKIAEEKVEFSSIITVNL